MLATRFPTMASEKMSDKYVVIDTNQVIKNMLDYGFEATSSKYPKTRTVEGKFGLHQVEFMHQRDIARKSSILEAPRIIFLNSYNGSTRAQLVSGIIRFICSNGMISGSHIAKERVRHIGDPAHAMMDRMKVIAKETEALAESISAARAVRLDRAAIRTFQERAAGLVYKTPDESFVHNIGLVRRREDAENDVWTVFNRIQENIIKGGIPTLNAAGQRVLTAPVRDIRKDVALNQDLWDLMEDTAKEYA
jgi:hypothetical protein